MTNITPIIDDGMKLIQRKAKDTSKLERYVRKYDTYTAANGDIVSLYETKGQQGLGLYARIHTPWDNSNRVIKYSTPDGIPTHSTPIEMRETWNGNELRRLSNKNGEWVDRNGEAWMIRPHAYEWSELPKP